MRFGIPLLEERVAPRCTIADSVLLVTLKRQRILKQSVVRLDNVTWIDLARILADEKVDTLVCGGISRANRDSVLAHEVEVIDNVAGTAQEVLEALRRGGLRSGFGLGARDETGAPDSRGEGCGDGAGDAPDTMSPGAAGLGKGAIDCLDCGDRPCLRGEGCPYFQAPSATDAAFATTLEAAWDVACEDQRTLCRLAELVYFALEMGYTRLGVAFCTDLLEPATVLTSVLRRFFDVVPVCCRVGSPAADEQNAARCNPVVQAEVLNRAATDLNVLVGLCVGADGILCRASRAPVTTIFVKDKSLANNPIGAVYSHYHLEDI